MKMKGRVRGNKVHTYVHEYMYMYFSLSISPSPSLLHSPLYFVGMKIFDEFRVCETLMISDNVMASWFKVQYSSNSQYFM